LFKGDLLPRVGKGREEEGGRKGKRRREEGKGRGKRREGEATALLTQIPRSAPPDLVFCS